jgi:hypothetical protein
MKLAFVAAMLALVGLAFAQSWTPVSSVPGQNHRFSCQVPANQWTYVFLQGGASGYVVPANKYFVVTTMYRPSYPEVLANGQVVTMALWPTDIAWSGSPTRAAFAPGTVLTAGPGDAHLWGYLEPVN